MKQNSKRGLVIATNRGFYSEAYWVVIYEAEDELVKTIENAELYKRKDVKIAGKPIFRFIGQKVGFDIDSLCLGNRQTFYYDMSPSLRGNKGRNKPNNSVCMIDYFLSEDELKRFYDVYSNVAHLFVSSREVYDFLQEHNPPRKVEHLPLTLPDKYAITKDTRFSKQYDLVLPGRQNQLLIDWLHQYEKTHEITYVFRGKHDTKRGQFPYYTNKGDFVGWVNTRDQYIDLLQKSRVAFYSTPGIDCDERQGTNSFHQVTPRFLEEIASGCNVLACYIDNSDTRFFELDKMAHRVTSYEDFERALEQAIEEPPDMAVYASYLEKHYTSVIARQLEAILKADG